MLRAASSRKQRRHEFLSGLTDANGLWAPTFDEAFQTTPHVNVAMVNPATGTTFRVMSVTAAGFSVHIYRPTTVSILGIEVPGLTVANIANQPCYAVAIEVYS